MMNGRPLTLRKQVQLMIALTLLAWATQTLYQQWGFGQGVSVQERFIEEAPRSASATPATLEIRSEARVSGTEVVLRQVARWSEADEAVFAPVAELVVLRLGGEGRGELSMMELRSTLREAGVNLGMVRIAGAIRCAVTQVDAAEGSPASVTRGEQWEVLLGAVEVPAWRQENVSAGGEMVNPHRDLRRLLLGDLAQRLNVPIDSLHVQFNPQDGHLLNLSEPHFGFHVQPRRIRGLGEVVWDVMILTDGEPRKVTISASARAWQEQVVIERPVALRQIIRQEDVTMRRVLAERLPEQMLLSMEQVVGQQAAMDLRPGTVLTARMIEATPLVRPGQLVTVVLQHGTVQLTTVARAMEAGTFGQTIRVRNESTRDVHEVTLTGPQMGRMGGQ